MAAHIRVAGKELPQSALVVVLKMTIRFVPHPSAGAEGGSNVQAVPHSTVLFVAHVIVGGVVSTTVTVWLQVFVLLQTSIAAQVRVAEKVLPHSGLVVVFKITTRLVPQPSAGAEGG